MHALENLSAQLGALLESQVDLWKSYVDPREAFVDDGEVWAAIGGTANSTNTAVSGQVFKTDNELDIIRERCRWLANENEFAINGHENRVSYIVGWGHTYNVVGRDGDVPQQSIQRVRAVLKAFEQANRWSRRQQEALLRFDRDGEVFIRYFFSSDGILRIRFVEPAMVRTPTQGPPNAEFGVQTDKDDVETVECYHIVNGSGGTDAIEARFIQHRKANVDANCKRGIPLFYPVRKNLNRAAKLLRNISTASEIQTAIAMIRKHAAATKEAVRTFVNARADLKTTSEDGKTQTVLKYPPGAILDSNGQTEYQFPNAGMDVEKYVKALDAELRAIAARLVMPEFMLTSNAANANFSSTMIAEGPAVKMFERLQQTMICDDLEVLNMALQHAANSRLLTHEEVAMCEIQAEPPTVRVRDGLQESQIRQTDMAAGILSPQTAAAQAGYDYETEQDNIERARERSGGAITVDRPALPPVPSESNSASSPPSESIQATALNGAQIASLKDIAIAVATGELPSGAAAIVIHNAFPSIPEAQIAELLNAMKRN